MPHPSSSRRAAAVAVVAACLALAVAGRADAGTPAGPARRPTEVEAAPVDAEAAVAALAEGWWATYRRIRVGRALLAEGDRFLVDPYRADVEAEHRSFAAGAGTLRLSALSAITVTDVAVEGTTAVVTSCVVDADLVLTHDTELVTSAVTATRHRAEAHLTDEGWRLAEHGTLASAPGTACPPRGVSPRR